VGIKDYSKSARGSGGKPLLHDLPSSFNDAKEMCGRWLSRRAPLYEDAHLDLLPGPDGDASRATILRKLDGLARRARADDLVLLFFAGHGYLQAGGGKSTFVFCCPDYDPKAPARTSLTSRELYEALAAIPCRKIVFLDACHAGDLASTPVRDLTPGGKGPTILAACSRGESSWEDPKRRHGVFTYALLEALGQAFEQADENRDGRLDARELFQYTDARLPALLREINKEGSQHPTRFPAELEGHPLVGKTTAGP
jgi:uncharacterized caspase-like protein